MKIEMKKFNMYWIFIIVCVIYLSFDCIDDLITQPDSERLFFSSFHLGFLGGIISVLIFDYFNMKLKNYD